MKPYRLLVDGDALKLLDLCTHRERERFIDVIDSLLTHPNQRGDFSVRSETGRVYEVKLLGVWQITFWADVASRELIIENTQKVPKVRGRRVRRGK